MAAETTPIGELSPADRGVLAGLATIEVQYNPYTATVVLDGDTTVNAALASVPVLRLLLPTLSEGKTGVQFENNHLVIQLMLGGSNIDAGFDAATRATLNELLQPEFMGHATASAALVIDSIQGPAILLRFTQSPLGTTRSVDPDAVLNTQAVGAALEQLAATVAKRLGLALDGELEIRGAPISLTAQ